MKKQGSTTTSNSPLPDHSDQNHSVDVAGVWRFPKVHKETGLSRTTLWRKVKDGSFPAPLKLTAHNIGWLAAEVLAWRDSLSRVVPA